MEKELEKFRQKKKLEERKKAVKEKISTQLQYWQRKFLSLLLPEDLVAPKSSEVCNEDPSETDESPPTNKKLAYLVLSLQILAWLVLYIGFLKIEFGAVYFCVSLLLIIYWNTRTSGKRKGEVSAYSVFNKDCQSIDGTLKSEHLEKQLIYRNVK